MVRRFIAYVRQIWGRAGAFATVSALLPSCYITPPCLPPNYRGFSRSFAVLSWVCAGRTAGASPRPTLLTGLSFGLSRDCGGVRDCVGVTPAAVCLVRSRLLLNLLTFLTFPDTLLSEKDFPKLRRFSPVFE